MPPKGKVTTRVGPPRASRKRQASNSDQKPTKRTRRTRTANANDDEDDEDENHEPEEEDEADDTDRSPSSSPAVSPTNEMALPSSNEGIFPICCHLFQADIISFAHRGGEPAWFSRAMKRALAPIGEGITKLTDEVAALGSGITALNTEVTALNREVTALNRGVTALDEHLSAVQASVDQTLRLATIVESYSLLLSSRHQ